MKSFGELPDDALIRGTTVRQIMNCSSVTIWRHCKAGRFPTPIRFTKHGHMLWRVSDLRAFQRGEWAPRIPNPDEVSA